MRTAETTSFEEFMRFALYDPQHGYYSRRVRSVGERGDFTTAPMLSNSLGRAIAVWAERAMRETGCRNLIEIGPGEGALAESVRNQLPALTRWRTRLHLVETSTPLVAKQKARLGSKAIWHSNPAEALNACDGRALIFSNELVDAFPVRRFEKTADGWLEIAVRIASDGSVHESLLAPAPLPESSTFHEEFAVGQRIEVHDSYRRWLNEWLPFWKSGRMLTIDYGATPGKIYQRRPRGTVRAYLFQQRLEGAELYQNIGRQDLTADVNFTDLVDWTRPWLENARLESLAGFLKRHGIGDREFTAEDGAGGAFMVLEQARKTP